MTKLWSKRGPLLDSGVALLLLELSKRCADKSLCIVQCVSTFHNDDKDIYLNKDKCIDFLQSAKDLADRVMKSRIACLLHVLVLNDFKSLSFADACYDAFSHILEKVKRDNDSVLVEGVKLGLCRLLRKIAEYNVAIISKHDNSNVERHIMETFVLGRNRWAQSLENSIFDRS